MRRKKTRKRLKIYVIPDQHWDPYWRYKPEVSERMGVNNIRQALDIMKENSRFKYVIAQLYLWQLFKKYFPERVEEAKRRVEEGRIEIADGGYINPDLNLPSGESLIRNFFYAKRAFEKELGVKVKCAWCMDSFGQSGQLPQIFQKLGLKFHSAKRGANKDLPGVFIWQGVDGTRIFFDRQPMAHHGITAFPPFSVLPSIVNPNEKLEKLVRPIAFPLALIALYLPDLYLWISTKGRVRSFQSALKYLAKFFPDGHIFIPHGFLADGARPNAWIEYICRVYSSLSRNKMFIALPSDFLKHLEKIKSTLSLIKGELNGPTEPDGEPFGALPGSYSARIDVKQRARKIERLLYLTEFLETVKMLEGGKYRDSIELWKTKSLTDFHDGICGTLTDDNYKILRQESLSLIKKLRRIVAEDFKILAGKQAILNPLPWLRQGLVKLDKKWQLVEALPASFGPVKKVSLDKKFTINLRKKILITPFYKVRWENGIEVYQNNQRLTGEKFGRIRIQDEDGDTYFWNVSGEYWDKIMSVNLVKRNNFQIALLISSKWRKTKIFQEINFYLHTPRIEFSTLIVNQAENVRFQVHLPFTTNLEDSTIEREIPAGFIREGESTGQTTWHKRFGEKYAYYDRIKCVQNWIHFKSGEKGIAIFNDGLPEHEIVGQTCLVTLLRCVGRVGTEGKGLDKIHPTNVPWRAGSPHPIPLAQERGIYKFRYTVCPIKREEVARECYEFLFPLMFVHGKNKKEKNFWLFSTSDPGVIPLAIKKAEDKDAVVVRLLETEGKERNVELRLNPEFHFKYVKIANLMEETTVFVPISDIRLEDGTTKRVITIRMKSQEIVTLILE